MVNPATDDLDEILANVCEEYVSYTLPDVDTEKKLFEENIDDLLTRLDEYCLQIDLIRNDSAKFLPDDVSVIHTKMTEMGSLFKKIDNLERFVNHVQSNLEAVEGQVVQAEQEMSALSSIKNKIKSFNLPFMNKNPTPTKKKEQFTPSPICDTASFFVSPETSAASSDSAG